MLSVSNLGPSDCNTTRGEPQDGRQTCDSEFAFVCGLSVNSPLKSVGHPKDGNVRNPQRWQNLHESKNRKKSCSLIEPMLLGGLTRPSSLRTPKSLPSSDCHALKIAWRRFRRDVAARSCSRPKKKNHRWTRIISIALAM